MPKIRCKCDHVIPLNEIPNAHEWLTISDKAYDAFHGTVDAEKLYDQMKIMVVCDQCHRLWAFWNGVDKQPAIYQLEEGLPLPMGEG